ncbi:YncE family protein [Sphaerisporangium rufum]|uniref:YncE family protein n=1 Tax=Sphaerisporangium rufum TaxID=1381558 RepID=UPI00194F2D03|nr:hypothetical protein [Sphaerisporangium rufum]
MPLIGPPSMTAPAPTAEPPVTAGTSATAGSAVTHATATHVTARKIAYAKRARRWQLVLDDGEVRDVPEALVKAPADAANAGDPVPFQLSGDGRHFFYYRRSDGRFVERTLDSAERVVDSSLTVGGLNEQWTTVSADGAYVVIETSGPGIWMVDLRTGKELRPTDEADGYLVGFSPDQQRLLLASYARDQVTVYDRRLRTWTRLKTRVTPHALAGDYVTAVVLVYRKGRYRELQLLDLRTGRTTAPVTVRLPHGRYVKDVDFDGAGHLIVRSDTPAEITYYQVSAVTGEAKRLRTIGRPRKDRVLPGDNGR